MAPPKRIVTLHALIVATLVLSLGSIVRSGARTSFELIPASHAQSRSIAARATCPPALPAGSLFDADVTFRNRGRDPLEVRRAAVTLNVGRLSTLGPRAFAVSTVVDAAGIDGRPGEASITVPLLVPSSAQPGSFVTFALGFFGSAAGSGRRQHLATAACAVEVITSTTPVLARIEVTPAAASVPTGRTQTFIASGTFSDGSVQAPLAGVTWTSDRASVVTVDTTGTARALDAGSARIRATRTGISSQPVTVTVTTPVVVSVGVVPQGADIAVGATVQFTATAMLNDGTARDVTGEVVWTSTPASVATISASGLATGVAHGDATITATHVSGVSGSAAITVGGPTRGPAVATVLPTRGTALGGTAITISGRSFTPSTTVRIGGIPATETTFVSPTVLTARTPPGAVGTTVDVTVSDADGSATARGSFTYLFPFSVPGALALEAGTTRLLAVTLLEPATTPITVSAASADSTVATLSSPVVIAPGRASIDIPLTAGPLSPATVTANGMTGARSASTVVVIAIGESSSSTSVIVTASFSELCAALAIPCTIEVPLPVVATLVTGEAAAAPVGLDVIGAPALRLSLASGGSRGVTLALATPAPAGGRCVELASTNAAVATVDPPQRCLEAGARSFSFTVTGVAAGEVTISAVSEGEQFLIDAFVGRPVAPPADVLAPTVGVQVSPAVTITPVVGVNAAESVTVAPVVGLCVTPYPFAAFPREDCP